MISAQVTTPQDIPHGDSFGLPAPEPTALGKFARNPGGAYVFDAADAANALFAEGDIKRRVDRLVAPSQMLDDLLDGVPKRLHEREHGRNAQVYAGPAGAGAYEPARNHRVDLNVSRRLTGCFTQAVALPRAGRERPRLRPEDVVLAAAADGNVFP